MIGRVRSTASRAYRRARASVRGSAVVVTYHRVADLDSDPMLLAVSPADFAEQVEELAARYELITFGQLIDDMRERRTFGGQRVVLTFDDGYADNLSAVMPVLERHGVPGTVFVASAAIDATTELWWDEVERLLLTPGELPERLEFELDEDAWSFDVGAARTFSESDARAGWDITRPVAHARQQLFVDVSAYIKNLRPAPRAEAMSTLRDAVGDAGTARDTHRTLTADELRRLDAGDLVEIGAHTVDHPRLARLPHAQQVEQVVEGKRTLESLIGHQVVSFSYPYGTETDYDGETVDVVSEAGLRGACTTRFGVTVPWTSRFEVPRCPTSSVGGKDFAEQVAGWFSAGR